MVSSAERNRLAMLFDKQEGAIRRQKASLTRMNLMLLEASAALFEIANTQPGIDWAAPDAAKRAQAALDRMEVIRGSAAATTDDGEESNGE
jgi:hypothetical protein